MKKSARNVCRFKIKLYLCNRNRERYNGRLAQLVQSICLTSRGSAVRIRQRPLRYEIDSRKPFWAFSSAGSEHLPYKQRVGGSNPSTPTSNKPRICEAFLFFICLVRNIFYAGVVFLKETYYQIYFYEDVGVGR